MKVKIDLLGPRVEEKNLITQAAAAAAAATDAAGGIIKRRSICPFKCCRYTHLYVYIPCVVDFLSSIYSIVIRPHAL